MSENENNSYTRNTKKDKARRNYEVTGGKSKKHIRLQEAIAEKGRQDNPIIKLPSKSSK
jgi:hypothetical protein